MKHLAYLSAIAYANFIQEQGMHAIVVIDNLANHARAYYDLMLPVSPPSPSTIASLQAQQLETVSQLRGWAGGGSITAFAILDEKLVDHAFDDRKVTQVMEGVCSFTFHRLFICSAIYRSICLSFHSFIHPTIHQSINQSTNPSILNGTYYLQGGGDSFIT